MKRFLIRFLSILETFWPMFIGIFLVICFVLLGVYLKNDDNQKDIQLESNIKNINEINYAGHSYLRIYESDGYSTTRHLIHNPDCECNKFNK